MSSQDKCDENKDPELSVQEPPAEEPPAEEPTMPRLEFSRGLVDVNVIHEGEVALDYLKQGHITCFFEGKIFYATSVDEQVVVYTQGRNDLPKRMFIRGKELQQESYLPLISVLFPLVEKNKDFTIVFMVSRQDLLIRHKRMDGVQVFFLGCIIGQQGFTPSSVLVETCQDVKQLVVDNDIETVSTYATAEKLYMPAKITDPKGLVDTLDQSGAFIHTADGRPTTLQYETAAKISDFFCDSQNNTQLFVRLVFLRRIVDCVGLFGLNELSNIPDCMEDVQKKVLTISEISPDDKVAEFVKLVENFRRLIKFFCQKKVSFGIAANKVKITMDHDTENEKEIKMMEKPLKALNTFLKIIKNNLNWNKKQGVHKKSRLDQQITDSIFKFFKHEPNLNNCCHLLKHVDRLSAV